MHNAEQRTAAPVKKKRRGKRSLFFFTSSAFFIALGALVAGGALYLVVILRSLPSPDQFNAGEVNQSTKIYDRTGSVLLYEIHGDEKRTVVPFLEIPQTAKDATLAAEDAEFYTEPAFDWRGIARAVLVNLRQGTITQGGSTITQQLAKNIFLSPERTITRKIKELILAFELESKYSKDEILGFYLNQIPYGSNAYGIEAASQTYLGKSVRDLSLSEAATLGALIKAPSYYSPWGTHLKDLLAQRDIVLDRMVKLGKTSSENADKAKKEQMKFLPPSIGSIRAPHFSLAVKDYLIERYGESLVNNGGLKVISSLDMGLQETAERVVAEGTKKNVELYGSHNAALVAQDPKTGQVLALVGSKDYFGDPEPAGCVPGKSCKFEGNYDVATQGMRQPGSALKPFVYMTAFTKGYTPETVEYDVSTEFDTRNDPATSYRPSDFDGLDHGPVSFKEALARSLNIPAVKALYLAGFDDVLANLHAFGITTLKERWRYGLSLTLGGGEVKLIDLVNAYGTMSQEGMHHAQVMVLRVEDAKGNVLESYQDENERAIDPQYTRLITKILSDPELRAPIFGSTNALTLFPDHIVALKTGTSEDHRDAWTVGYTPSLVVGVWSGNNDNTPMIRQGSSILAAVPMWSAFLKDALKNFPSESFTEPEPVPLPTKPMLNGLAEFTPVLKGVAYPQIHSILYYVNRADPLGAPPTNPQDDPEFDNWESGVVSWARNHIAGFQAYNRQLPEPVEYIQYATGSNPAATPGTIAPTQAFTIQDLSPATGQFVTLPFTIQANIYSPNGLRRVELYWNRRLINSIEVTDARYHYLYRHEGQLDPQNLFEIKATDATGASIAASTILYH
jgi:membrane peptidoglycan carboxypeptidase